MTALGKERRLGRLFENGTGAMLCIPIDHGMQVGAIAGLEDPDRLIGQIADGGADAVIVNPGLMRRHHKVLQRIPTVILRLDQTTMWRTGGPFGYENTHTRRVARVQDAVELGADAVITYLFTCNADPMEETRCFEINRDVAEDCRRFGIIHVIEAMAANGGFARADDPDLVSMNCRIAGELGADVIKTDWCGTEGMARVAAQSLAPVVVAGGGKAGSDEELVQVARDCVAAGARGLMFGRNTFQREDVTGTVAMLRGAMSG